MLFTAENILLVGSILLFVSIIVGKTGYRFGVPALLLFLVVGMIFGSDGLGLQFHNAKEAQFIGMVALSIILFSGGMDTKFTEIKPILTPGIVLSTAGVLLTALFTGLFIWWLSGMSWTNIHLPLITSLLLASTMSSTDSASVFAILRSQKMNLKHNLRPMLELESGSNDPMAYMLTIVLIQFIQSSGMGVPQILGSFAIQFIVGAATGYFLGKLAILMLNRLNIDNQALYPILLLSFVFFTFSITDLLKAANSYGTYQINVMLDESLSSRQIEQAREALEEAVNGVENCTATVEISGMQELTSQLDMGLTVQVSGNDIDTMTALSEKVVDMVNEMDGFTNATNGLGSGDATINLQIDRDKVRSYGLTVAQVYQQIAAKLTTTTTAQTPVAIDGSTMNVQISNNLDPMTKENMMDMTFTTSVMAADGTTETGTCTLGDMATWVTGSAPDSITSKNQTRYISVTADAVEGTNTTTETRALEKKLNEFAASDEMPEGCSFYMGGGSEINGMVVDQMGQWMFLALPFVYLVMVAQFQSLLSPFIVLFTIPLAFTGGLLGLLLTGQQLTMISLMGFIVLMGTVVNNGIVFVDYANQLRIGGMERRAALIATGKTRMRPILMTTLTTVLAMLQLVFSGDMASQLMSGMAIVIIFGLTYATLMTLYVVPLMYDILFKKPPLNVDIGDENLDDIPDDAAEYIAQNTAQPE